MPVPFPAPLGPPPASLGGPPPDESFFWRLERGLRAVTYYPLLVGQITLFIAIAFGVFGGELGLEALFWHEHWADQLGVGLATGWLFGVVLHMNLLLLRPDWVSAWHQVPASVPKGWVRWWSLFPTRRRRYAVVRRDGHWLFWWMVVLLAVVWGGKLGVRLYRALVGTDADPWAFFRDQWAGGMFALGYAGSMTTALGLFLLDEYYPFLRNRVRRWVGRPPVPDVRPLRSRVAGSEWFQALVRPNVDPTEAENRPWRQIHAIAFQLTLASWVVYVVCVYLSLGRAEPLFSPAVLISLTLIVVNTVVGIVAFRFPARLIAAVVVGLMYLISPQRMTLPDLDYARPRDLSDNQYNRLYRETVPRDAAGRPLLIDAREPLAAVRERWKAAYPAKPRLVVLAVSGGGIRAAVWTAVVLEGLEKELGPQLAAPFREHVRLVAGASGGMVAAGAYATFDGPIPQGMLPKDQESVRALRPFSAAVAHDSLSAVVQTMALRDFTWAGVPTLDEVMTPNVDRGRRLEEIWDTNWRKSYPDAASPFRRTIQSLRAAEAAGTAPSVVFSPVFVEDTKRMLISNLDLRGLTAAGAPRLDNPDPVGTAPAMEFFRVFPAATDFTLGTAARLSASFPVVSPAVALPTIPERRLVDGGYYDNYGLDLTTRWLVANQPLVEEFASGVVIVQVRAFPMEADGLAVTEVEASSFDRFLGAVSAPAQAVLTARSQAAHHRNAEMLALAGRAFNAGKAVPFLQTVVFELNQPAALSWYLTPAEKRDVVRGFYDDDDRTRLSPRVERQLVELKRWFGNGDGTWRKP